MQVQIEDISPVEKKLRFEMPWDMVSARLGEWFEIGGVAQSASATAGGIGSSRQASASSGRRIWVRVDEVRP